MTMRVPFAASSVATARQQLKKWMVENGGSRDQVEDGRVVISELVPTPSVTQSPSPTGRC